jgi:hypothetical protein
MLRENQEAAERSSAYHLDNLDAALHIISKIGVLYHQLERSQQKKLLREVIERIVVDAEGTVLRIELQPPFAYLHDLTCRAQQAAETEAEKTKTSAKAGSCSSYALQGGPEGQPPVYWAYTWVRSSRAGDHSRQRSQSRQGEVKGDYTRSTRAGLELSPDRGRGGAALDEGRADIERHWAQVS